MDRQRLVRRLGTLSAKTAREVSATLLEVFARTSSTVSMTTMGVEELSKTFSRSIGLAGGLWGEFICI